MLFKNTRERFGIVTIFIHWVMALLLIVLTIIGLYMVNIPISAQKLKLFGWHKELGLLALFLVMFRIVWRLGNILPSLDSLNIFERFAAKTVHWLFYVFMFAIPITGWIVTSSAGLPASFFGLFVLPNIVATNNDTLELFQMIHMWLSYGLIALFCAHVGAALKHHFINKDDILRRMLR